MPLQLPCIGLRFDRNTRLQDDRQMTLGRRHMAWLMRFEAHSAKQDGGEDGIRTHEKLLTSTPLAGERLRPLGHLSVAPLDKEKRRHNQQAGAIIAEKSSGRQLRKAAEHRHRIGPDMANRDLCNRFEPGQDAFSGAPS